MWNPLPALSPTKKERKKQIKVLYSTAQYCVEPRRMVFLEDCPRVRVDQVLYNTLIKMIYEIINNYN